MWLARGLRVASREGYKYHAQHAWQWQALAARPIYNASPRGPFMVFQKYMSELGVEFHAPWTLIWNESAVHLLETPLPALAAFIRRVLQHHMVRQAERRTRLVGLTECDHTVTAASVRKRETPFRGALVALLSDAVWTQRRKHVARLATSDKCLFCEDGTEDLDHLLYRCPHWEQYRCCDAETLAFLQTSQPATKYCFHCPRTAPEDVKNRWGSIQGYFSCLVDARMKASHGA
eukprot:6456438-Amphidinium_carterae.1